MNYFEAFETIKTALEGAGIPPKYGRLAIQVRISDDDSAGTFYILASEGGLVIEPYDYYDNDADILTKTATLLDIIAGKLDFKKAVTDKSVSVSGNTEALTEFFGSIPKKKATVKKTAAKKPATAAKKPAAKKSTTGAAKKKTEEAKMTDDKKNTSGKETIEEVVEKETKPKK